MKKKILVILLIGLVMIGITGCNSNDNSKDINKPSDNKENQTKTISAITSLSGTEEIDGIEYKVEKIEDGDYIMFIKNNNSTGVRLFAYLLFYKDGDEIDHRQSQNNIDYFAPGAVGAIHLKDINYDYNYYKVRFDVQENKYEDYSKYITFKEEVKNDKLIISPINDSNEEVVVGAYVIFYKNNKVVAYSSGNNAFGDYIINSYPKYKDGNRIEYYNYEIYIDSAYKLY